MIASDEMRPIGTEMMLASNEIRHIKNEMMLESNEMGHIKNVTSSARRKLESDEKYNKLSQNFWRDTGTRVFLIKQRYDERLRNAVDKAIAAKAASLEGRCANCSGVGNGGSPVTVDVYDITCSGSISHHVRSNNSSL